MQDRVKYRAVEKGEISGGDPVCTMLDDKSADCKSDIEIKLTPIDKIIDGDCKGTEVRIAEMR